jgi:hypothetical protein
MQHHKWGSIGEIESMILFERDLLVDMLIQFIKEKERELGEQ